MKENPWEKDWPENDIHDRLWEHYVKPPPLVDIFAISHAIRIRLFGYAIPGEQGPASVNPFSLEAVEEGCDPSSLLEQAQQAERVGRIGHRFRRIGT